MNNYFTIKIVFIFCLLLTVACSAPLMQENTILKAKVMEALVPLDTDIQITVAGSRVYLEGVVSSHERRMDIITTVKNVNGVTDVKSRLIIPELDLDDRGRIFRFF